MDDKRDKANLRPAGTMAALELVPPTDPQQAPRLQATGGTRIPATLVVVDVDGNQVATYTGQPGIAPTPKVDSITIEILFGGGR